LPYVAAFACWYNSKIVVAHIVPPEIPPAIPSGPIPVALDQNWQEAERKMKRFVRNEPFTEVPHEFVVERGEITDVIASLASQSVRD
jgi:hypothetical protein